MNLKVLLDCVAAVLSDSCLTSHNFLSPLGLIGFKMAGVHDLRLPLLALIDYRGTSRSPQAPHHPIS
jgi:hypothetical protein